MARDTDKRREELRDKLVTIAEAHVSKSGLASLRARALAAQAGCSVGAIYNVFDDMTGLILADLLARTDHKEGFILMGHSLGARVIYYVLEALSTTKNANINDVYLLGGAVGLDNSPDWDAAVSAVSGSIFNVYSTRDDVLRYLYQGANAFLSRPIGLGPIRSSSSKLKNLDASSIVDSHMNYKNSLESAMQAIHQGPVHPISKYPNNPPTTASSRGVPADGLCDCKHGPEGHERYVPTGAQSNQPERVASRPE